MEPPSPTTAPNKTPTSNYQSTQVIHLPRDETGAATPLIPTDDLRRAKLQPTVRTITKGNMQSGSQGGASAVIRKRARQIQRFHSSGPECEAQALVTTDHLDRARLLQPDPLVKEAAREDDWERSWETNPKALVSVLSSVSWKSLPTSLSSDAPQQDQDQAQAQQRGTLQDEAAKQGEAQQEQAAQQGEVPQNETAQQEQVRQNEAAREEQAQQERDWQGGAARQHGPRSEPDSTAARAGPSGLHGLHGLPDQALPTSTSMSPGTLFTTPWQDRQNRLQTGFSSSAVNPTQPYAYVAPNIAPILGSFGMTDPAATTTTTRDRDGMETNIFAIADRQRADDQGPRPKRQTSHNATAGMPPRATAALPEQFGDEEIGAFISFVQREARKWDKRHKRDARG